jgi:hypothetical protein
MRDHLARCSLWILGLRRTLNRVIRDRFPHDDAIVSNRATRYGSLSPYSGISRSFP